MSVEIRCDGCERELHNEEPIRCEDCLTGVKCRQCDAVIGQGWAVCTSCADSLGKSEIMRLRTWLIGIKDLLPEPGSADSFSFVEQSARLNDAVEMAAKALDGQIR